jgi:hypothetical protein
VFYLGAETFGIEGFEEGDRVIGFQEQREPAAMIGQEGGELAEADIR